MDIELVRVASTSSDTLREIDDVFDDLTAYSQRVDGVARRHRAAHEFATALPPGHGPHHKYAFLAKLGDVAVGLVDIIDGYPSRGTAFIGLLAIREIAQRSGLGRKLFQEVERFACDNLETHFLRLAVVETNPVIGFWTKMGFYPTGEVKPFEGEAVKSRSILMEKELAVMTQDDLFRLVPSEHEAREAAERLFAAVKVELMRALPASAEILHVGATAIPGCLTKGDLDVAVRVDSGDFGSAAAELAARYSRNIGSTRTEEFATFEDETRTPHLGIQLTAKGGVFDVFHCFADALRADAELLRRYNLLKIGHDGRPMDQYRAAKDAFVMEVLRLFNSHLGAINAQLF